MPDADATTEATEEAETTSTSLRWRYTNDVVAVGYLAAFVVLTVLDGAWVVDLDGLPLAWRTAGLTIALIAAAWTFGGGAVRGAARLLN